MRSSPTDCASESRAPAASPTRVLFLSDHLGYPSGVIHGATTYFLEVLPRLNRPGLELTACFFRGPHPARARLEAQGVNPIFLSRSRWDPRVLSDLVRLIRARRIQVIHAAGLKGMLVARLAARWTGARCMIHLHDLAPIGPLTRLAQQKVAGWTHAAIGISRPVCRYAIRAFGMLPERTYLLHNALSLEPYQHQQAQRRLRVRRSLGIHPDTPVAAVIGRFYRVKGQDAAVRAMTRVHQQVPEAILLLAGDGPQRPRCEALARDLGVSRAMRFLGQRRDIPDLLQAIDVLLIPSESEGLGYAAVEALAAGRPIVAYNVGGLTDAVLHGRTGYLAPSGNERALADRLSELLTDAALRDRLGEEAQRHAQRFNAEAHADALAGFYRQLATGEHPPTALTSGVVPPQSAA